MSTHLTTPALPAHPQPRYCCCWLGYIGQQSPRGCGWVLGQLPTPAMEDGAIDRAEARADRLQARLDEERALTSALRKQLRESSTTQQRTAQQVRQLVGAPNAPSAPGGSVADLQRTVAGLRDRLDLEKKAASAAHAERVRLEQRLATGTTEQQNLQASQQALRAELQRRSLELENAKLALREAGRTQDDAVGRVSSLTLSKTKERQHLEKEIVELRTALELERKRATNRATRAAAAEAKLRARGGGGGGDGSSVASDSSALDAAYLCGGESEVGSEIGERSQSHQSGGSGGSGGGGGGGGGVAGYDLAGRRAMDFDVEAAGGSGSGSCTAPSASVAGMLRCVSVCDSRACIRSFLPLAWPPRPASVAHPRLFDSPCVAAARWRQSVPNASRPRQHCSSPHLNTRWNGRASAARETSCAKSQRI